MLTFLEISASTFSLQNPAVAQPVKHEQQPPAGAAPAGGGVNIADKPLLPGQCSPAHVYFLLKVSCYDLFELVCCYGLFELVCCYDLFELVCCYDLFELVCCCDLFELVCVMSCLRLFVVMSSLQFTWYGC